MRLQQPSWILALSVALLVGGASGAVWHLDPADSNAAPVCEVAPSVSTLHVRRGTQNFDVCVSTDQASLDGHDRVWRMICQRREQDVRDIVEEGISPSHDDMLSEFLERCRPAEISDYLRSIAEDSDASTPGKQQALVWLSSIEGRVECTPGNVENRTMQRCLCQRRPATTSHRVGKCYCPASEPVRPQPNGIAAFALIQRDSFHPNENLARNFWKLVDLSDRSFRPEKLRIGIDRVSGKTECSFIWRQKRFSFAASSTFNLVAPINAILRSEGAEQSFAIAGDHPWVVETPTHHHPILFGPTETLEELESDLGLRLSAR